MFQCQLIMRNAYVSFVLFMIFSKVLYVTGQQRNSDRSISPGGNWYDKTKWSQSTKHQSSNSRSHLIEGSGDDESMDDLEPGSPGRGIDDEDDPYSGDEDDDIVGSGGYEPTRQSGGYEPTRQYPTDPIILSSTSAATTTIERVSVQIYSTPSTPIRAPMTELPRTPSPATTRFRIVETQPPKIVSTTIRSGVTAQVPGGRVPATTLPPVAPPSTTTTVRQITVTTVASMYDTNTTVRRGDRNGFEWILSPGVLTAVIGGAVVGLLAAILLVMFIVYRMRKKDEGSYALEEPKSPPTYSYAYHKAPTREFYA